jgi:hypothetical protein
MAKLTPPNPKAVSRCFCGVIVTADGAREAHRAQAEAKWVAAGHLAAERCLCRPCSQHSWDQHLAWDIADALHQEQITQDAERIAQVVSDAVRAIGGLAPAWEPLVEGVTAATRAAVEKAANELRRAPPVRDSGLTKEVSAKEIMRDKGVTKSVSYRWLRMITGRKNGTGKTLRAPLAEVEAYIEAGCPSTWAMKKRGVGR